MPDHDSGNTPAPGSSARAPAFSGTLAADGETRARDSGFLPAPDPCVADSARLKLAVRALSIGQPAETSAAADPISDIQAITMVLDAVRSGDIGPDDALDIGAGLVLLCGLRLRLDRLEADLLDAAQQVGLGWDVIAAIIGIPAEDAQRRHQVLHARQELVE